MNRAAAVLPKYVEDMNAILAKNTNRRLLFDADTGIINTPTQPFSNQAPSSLPVEGFEIWAHAVQSPYIYSYGGYAGIDTNGAGVLAGLKWARLYDPDALTADELDDYWTQINNMLHELAHVFGAGIGEYYKLASVQDTTGAAPFLAINVLDPKDAFWSDKQDFLTDPLLWNAAKTESLSSLTNREALIDYVKYSDLTAAILNGDYRNAAPMADLENITVRVVDANGVAQSHATVKIWSVVGADPYPSELLKDVVTGSDGRISFAWGGSANSHNNYDFLRLIKVYKEGFIASVQYISIFDTDIVKLVRGSDSLEITVLLKTQANDNTPKAGQNYIFIPIIIKK